MVAEGGGDGVDGVRGEVGCAVQGVDEEEGGAEEEAGWSGYHGLEAGGDGLANWEAFRSFFDDGTAGTPAGQFHGLRICVFAELTGQ